MGWQDAPVIGDQPPTQGAGWQSAPVVEDTDAPGPSFADQAKRQVGLAGRAVAQGVAALPLMAMDAGVGARNFVTGSNYDSPSSMWNTALDAYLPKPESGMEKATGAIESAMTGSRIPAPTAGTQAPAGFTSPGDAQKQILGNVVQNAQKQGYVVPPATSNPSMRNQVLETVAGKTSTQQGASAINDEATQNLAKRAFGLNTDAPLTPDSLYSLRSEAGQAYEPIRAAGTITPGPAYKQQLQSVLGKYQGADKSFPGLGKTDLSDIVKTVDQPTFDAGSAIDATKILRDKADIAFRAGDSGAGNGIKGISNAIETALDQGLQAKGPQYAQTLQNFRDARRTIAQTFTVQDAMNPATGNVSAAKLGAALRNGAPLTGPLRDAALFANAFPKAVQPPTQSHVNHLDMYAPALTAILGNTWAEKAAGLAVPLGRKAARMTLFSPFGQAGAIPRAAAPATGKLPMALIPGAESTQ